MQVSTSPARGKASATAGHAPDGQRLPVADPNAPSLRAERAREVMRANGPLIDDRCAFLAKHARGKDVLDVGCVNHSAAHSGDRDWLHAHLVREAKSCVGADVLADDVRLLQNKGFEVVQLDITRETLPRQFDVIVCGEVIEHVGNPEALLANCRRMLRPNGRLYLTTPNPWYVNYVLKYVFSAQPVVDSIEHVAWYDPGVLAELAGRAGFRLERFHGLRVTRTNTLRARIFFRMMPLWRALRVRKELFANSILYELAPIHANNASSGQ
ncbi:MAG: methyltransferase domain-containing protein [Acidobacteria bacterium]|nr:methyltransferase domain-containing protein [Acidobacteriota bacterium]